MPQSLKLLLFAVILVTGTQANAQNPSHTSNYPIASLMAPVNTNWSFYTDAESQTLYVDFEAISVNLRSIVIRDHSGAEIFRDQVADLPVNTIYEVDYSTFAKGEYTVELHSFTGMMSKKVRF